MFLSILLFVAVSGIAQGQSKAPPDNVVITIENNKTEVRTNEKGELVIHVSKKRCAEV